MQVHVKELHYFRALFSEWPNMEYKHPISVALLVFQAPICILQKQVVFPLLTMTDAKEKKIKRYAEGLFIEAVVFP